MDDKFAQLAVLGAGDFDHIDGSLIAHLKGTQHLLKQWQASGVLQDAGLYHAAYGTAGFSESLVSTDQRHRIARIIGQEAEDIVYRYCACDRDDFWPQFFEAQPFTFKNRFTNQRLAVNQQQLQQFCELTVANELEIASNNQAFIDEHGQGLYTLFQAMAPYLSSHANLAVEAMF